MQRDQLADLSGTLARAVALVDDLGDSGRQAAAVADRPSFLVAEPENDPNRRVSPTSAISTAC